MKVCTFEGYEGFGLPFQGEDFRVAVHAYKEGVNDVIKMQRWGTHVDSDECFMPLQGNITIITKEDGKLICSKPKPMEMCVVEKNTAHVIALEKGAIVQVIENANMDNTFYTAFEEGERDLLLTYL